MARNEHIVAVILLYILPKAMGTPPGTYFWRPRLAIDLGSPTTGSDDGAGRWLKALHNKTKKIYEHFSIEEPMLKEFHPAKQDVLDGFVVLIDPYSVGVTMITLASGIARAQTNADINPFEADLYINIYQWALRFLSLIPNWSAGTDGHFCRTLKTWRRRWQYMDSRVPDWMRAITPISKKAWAAEDLERKRFKAYAESAFIKHYRFPTKVFRNFDSFWSAQTSAFKPPSASLSQP